MSSFRYYCSCVRSKLVLRCLRSKCASLHKQQQKFSGWVISKNFYLGHTIHFWLGHTKDLLIGLTIDILHGLYQRLKMVQTSE